MSEAIKAAVKITPLDLLGLETVRDFMSANGSKTSAEFIDIAVSLLRPIAEGKSVIVPVEPTEAMIDAGWEINRKTSRDEAADPADFYRAMISASNT